MTEVMLIQAIQQALDQALEMDERVFLVGQDIGQLGGVFRATAGLLDKYGSDRLIEAPLGGASLVGVAIGAALYGLRPICEVQFADFIHASFNQIVNEAAKMRYRSNGEWTVPMVLRAPYGGGVGGGLYHSQSVEGFFTHVPGLKVVIPSNPFDAKGLLLAAVQDPDPVLYFEPKKGYRSLRGQVPDEPYTVPIGPAQVSREGTEVSVFAYGMMHHYCIQAAESIAGDGLEVEVVDLRTLYPVDRESILASIRKTGKALIVHEDHQTGGYGAEIAALLAEEGFAHLDGPVMRVCGPDVPGMPFSGPMQDWYMPNTDKIVQAIRELAAY